MSTRRTAWFRISAVAVVVLAAAVTVAVVHRARTSVARPNVVVIVLDTVRDDCVGGAWEDVPLTPAVDAVRREGTRFANTFTPAPWTVPAHASLFTGLYPHEHQAVHERFKLSDSLTTLAERLHAAGYATAGFTCNPWLSSNLGFNQGFDDYVEVYRQGTDDVRHAELASSGVIEWLKQRKADARPFLLFVNYLEAHLPYTPPADALRRLPAGTGGTVRESFSVAEAERYIAGVSPLSADDLQQVRRLYDAEIADQDVQVARVLDQLRRYELLDDTVLIITADHAEQFGRHELLGHEFSLYEPVLRVPLVVRYPAAFPAGGTVATPASLIDVVPTVADLLGLDVSGAALPGRSLRGLLEAGSASERVLLAEYSRPVTLIQKHWRGVLPQVDMSRYDRSLRALRLGAFKYIVGGRGREQLFNLVDDPGELRDLSAEMPEQLAILRAKLAEAERGS